jgi:hypothetical protein
MNYIEISQLNNVKFEYKVKGSDLYFISMDSSKKLLKLDLDSLEIKSELFDNVKRLKILGNLAIVERNEGERLATYDIEKERIIKEVENIRVSLYTFIDSCKMLYQSYEEDVLHIRDVCNGTDDYIMPGTLDYFSTLSDDILISSSSEPLRGSIIAYDFKNRTLAWEFDLREIGNFYSEVKKKWIEGYALNIIIMNNRIYVLTYPKLICLNSKTGIMLWQLEVKPDTISKFTYLEATNEILLFDSHQFHFINAITGVVVRSSMSIYEEVKKMGMTTFNSTTPVVDDKYIYITLCYSHKMLIFDRYTFEMVHVINMNTCKDAISPTDTPVVYGNKVLQRSSDGVMHVYADL